MARLGTFVACLAFGRTQFVSVWKWTTTVKTFTVPFWWIGRILSTLVIRDGDVGSGAVFSRLSGHFQNID